MENLSSLSKTDLESLLHDLKKYRILKKKLWSRAKNIFLESTRGGFRVELSKNMEESALESVFQKLSIDKKQVAFERNPRLSWGARLFIGDDLIDLSFNEITQKI